MRFRIALATFIGTAGLVTAAPAGATSFTATQLDSAKAGLQDLRELNLFTVGNLNSNSHVEGKTFVGGSLYGACGSLSCTQGAANQSSNATFGTGNGTYGAASSSRKTLSVVGNTNTSLAIQNGANGSSGKQGMSADVGGNVAYTQNTSSDGLSLRVGGNLASLQNVNAGPSITYGGTYSGNTGNGRVTRDASLANAGKGLAATLTAERDTMVTDLGNLSSVLASLSDTGTYSVNGSDISLNFTNANAGYNAITLNASVLFNANSLGNARNLAAVIAGSTTPLIINVLGTSGVNYYDSVNMNFSAALSGNTIFNLVNVSGLSVNSEIKGSLLGLNTTVINSSNITGSVAVNILNQNAEIHLASYSGTSVMIPAAPTAAPEVATWMMMVFGFGAVGVALRSQKRRERVAAAIR